MEALHCMIRYYQFNETSTQVMALFILTKVYQRITTRLFNRTNKDIKFSIKFPEAIALRIVLNDVHNTSRDMYESNVALRILTTINQELS